MLKIYWLIVVRSLISIIIASQATADICKPETENLLKVVNVESNDTLNVRTGYTTKYPVITELEPDEAGIKYVSAFYKSEECASLCTAYSQGGKALTDLIVDRCLNKNLIWYRIRSKGGVEGWASSKYLTGYKDPIVAALTDSTGVRHSSIDQAILSNDNTVKRKALTDINGVTYSTVDEAITSNDYEVILQALTSAEGVVYANIDFAINEERSKANTKIIEAIEEERKQNQLTETKKQQVQANVNSRDKSVDFAVNTEFNPSVIGGVLNLHEKEIYVRARYELDDYWNFPFFADDSGNKLDFEETENKEEFALFQLECSETPCIAKGFFRISYPWAEPRLTFKLTGYSKDLKTPVDTTLISIVDQVRSLHVDYYGFAIFNGQINQFILRQDKSRMSSDRVTVDLSNFSEAKMREFVSACYNKCKKVRVKGSLNINVEAGSAEIVAVDVSQHN